MGIANSADYSQIWSQPAGSPAKTNESLTSAMIQKLGSGLLGGQAGGAGLVSGLMGATPIGAIGAGVQAAGEALKQTMNPDNLSGSSTARNGGNMAGSVAFGSKVINFRGTQSADARTSAQADQATGEKGLIGGSLNYWLIGGAMFAGLLALKIVARG